MHSKQFPIHPEKLTGCWVSHSFTEDTPQSSRRFHQTAHSTTADADSKLTNLVSPPLSLAFEICCNSFQDGGKHCTMYYKGYPLMSDRTMMCKAQGVSHSLSWDTIPSPTRKLFNSLHKVYMHVSTKPDGWKQGPLAHPPVLLPPLESVLKVSVLYLTL